MRITFVLPGIAVEINGGVKIVYEYANRLAALGHTVHVIHPRTWDRLPGAMQQARAHLWPYYITLKHGGPTPWMERHAGVRSHLVPDLSARYIPEADAIVATFFRTAPFVNALPASRGKKYYLIQHYEDWAGSKEEVDATWRLPMHKIVICKWLLGISKELGEENRTTHIPNAMNLDLFRITQPVTGRSSKVVMLASPNRFKGTQDGIAALQKVKSKYPNLAAECFGTGARDSSLPDWIDYRRQPLGTELTALYNSASIFLQPSHAEGWGLTSTEAMACGCALVTTDNGGSGDFAINGDTALVTPVEDIDAMAAGVARLLDDDDLRLRIANSGERFVQQFTWQRATSSLETLLTENMP